ncbi:hypothetical protein [Myxococcus eversor]|uniref:hypothetical protein n=1 Tax=Myxococcus eversor TaxID=2709661 RepID=UPI0013D8ADCF|nr:hypothetical protein [Myxococcus eversor]
MMDRRSKPGPLSVPWAVAERSWAAYAQQYGTQQSVERMAERGGFYWGEMDAQCPEWREATDAWVLLAKENVDLKAEVARLTLELEQVRGGVAP